MRGDTLYKCTCRVRHIRICGQMAAVGDHTTALPLNSNHIKRKDAGGARGGPVGSRRGPQVGVHGLLVVRGVREAPQVGGARRGGAPREGDRGVQRSRWLFAQLRTREGPARVRGLGDG